MVCNRVVVGAGRTLRLVRGCLRRDLTKIGILANHDFPCDASRLFAIFNDDRNGNLGLVNGAKGD